MNDNTLGRAAPYERSAVGTSGSIEVSAVSWGAIFAGATAAAALSLILLILGTGLGLSSVSPFTRQGLGATAFGISTILWISFTQIAASGMGGYLAGRLRTRWLGTHVDEVYFRDTAHGFLAWGLATLVTAALLGSAIGSIVSGGAQAGAAVAGGAAATAGAAALPAAASAMRSGGDSNASGGPLGYYVDSLFRRDAAAAPGAAASAPMATPDDPQRAAAEVTRIYANAVRGGSLAPEDARYVGQMIAQRTGMAPADAEKRATDAFNRMQAKAQEAEAAARDAAEKARKAATYAALWVFVSLLIGAFVASLSATYGGRRRDL